MLYKKCKFLPLPSKFHTESENFFFLFMCLQMCGTDDIGRKTLSFKSMLPK